MNHAAEAQITDALRDRDMWADKAIAAQERLESLKEEHRELHYAWRHAEDRANTAERILADVRAFADELRTYCSPFDVAQSYATRLRIILGGPI